MSYNGAGGLHVHRFVLILDVFQELGMQKIQKASNSNLTANRILKIAWKTCPGVFNLQSSI